MEEIERNDNEFIPFLSSTDNEMTDLNTEFNTERGASQSTYRKLTKRSNQKPP
jgi:hypothetical protein